MRPNNIIPVPVAMDGQGMRSDALKKVLSEWDEDARGMPRYEVEHFSFSRVPYSSQTSCYLYGPCGAESSLSFFIAIECL
jgi:hypothetical protein